MGNLSSSTWDTKNDKSISSKSNHKKPPLQYCCNLKIAKTRMSLLILFNKFTQELYSLGCPLAKNIYFFFICKISLMMTEKLVSVQPFNSQHCAAKPCETNIFQLQMLFIYGLQNWQGPL